MSGRRLEISARAERDVQSLLRYSLRTWGENRRDEYAGELTGTFFRLLEFPELGMSRPTFFIGARSFPIGQHVIYYRVTSHTVRIVRVLHSKIDAEQVFRRPKQ